LGRRIFGSPQGKLAPALQSGSVWREALPFVLVDGATAGGASEGRVSG